MGRQEPRETAIVVEKTYDFLLWLLPKVKQFPRSYRFTLGDRMVNLAWDLLLLLEVFSLRFTLLTPRADSSS
jgi:hypothetical protein